MSEIKKSLFLSPTEEDNVEVVPRRRIERRKATRRTNSKPKLLFPDNIAKLRKKDDNTHLLFRGGDRRQKNRRKSKPLFLTADEILLLRKK